MANDGPPALAPVSTPLSPGSTAPANSNIKIEPVVGSPVNSEKTAVVLARLRELIAQPGTRAAVFSTDGGRLPQRGIPSDAPPIIVRSAGVRDVLNSANYWREKYPDFYPCFFPNQGWTIADLWDEYDVHLESPEFLKEVLHVIMYGNQQSSINFAYNWCLENQGKIDKLSGDLKQFEASPLAMVNEFFSEQELGQFPRQYLLHALWVLRDSMHRRQAKCHPILQADSVSPLVNDNSLQPVSNEDFLNMNFQQQHSIPMPLRKIINHSSVYHHTDCLLGSALPAQQLTGYSPVIHVPNMPRIRNVSFTPLHPPAPNLHRGGVAGVHAISAVPTQAMKQPQNMRRPDRSGSQSFTQPQQSYLNGENVRLPVGGHTHHPMGPPPHGGPRHFIPNIPTGPGQQGLYAPPTTVMTSPPIHPNQVAYSPATGHVIFPTPVSVPHQIHNPAYHLLGTHTTSHVTPFVNMANNTQHTSMQGPDLRSIQGISNQNVKAPGLYNPYDATRPEKAGFADTGSRKGGRGNSTNNVGRGRKISAGAFDRSVNNSNLSGYPNSGKFNPIDTNITKDKEFGCDLNFIGPKNTTVRQLHVQNIPDSISAPEIRTFFQNCAKVMPNSIDIKSGGDRKEFHYALVSFDSTHDTRKALETRFPTLKGKVVQVNVAKRYFCLGFNHRPALPAGQSTQPNPYSPQDARSDLHHVNEQHRQPKVQVLWDSPEARKAKKLGAKREDQTDGSPKKENTSKTISQSHSVENVIEKKKVKVAVKKEATDSPPANSTTALSKTGTVADEEEKAKCSDVDEALPKDNTPTSPETVTESIPVDAQAPLLVSLTKVNLPPADCVPKTVQEESKTAVPAVPAQGEQDDGNPVSGPLQEDALSDDDQKHDLSFHSAPELPPETSSDKDKDDQKVESMHEEEEKYDNTTGKHTQPCDQQPATTNAGGDPKATTNYNLGSDVREQSCVISAASKPPAELGRKNGVKQTESLNPYSKASKAQLKKVRDKEKKQKKKDKGEMAEKGEMQIPAKASITMESGEGEKLGKIPSRGPTQGLAEEDGGDNTQGKHFVMAVGGAITQDLQAQQKVDAQHVSRGASDQSGSSAKSAQLCEESGVRAVIATTKEEKQLGTLNNQRQTSKTGQSTKAIPAAIAVPKLDLLKKRSSTNTTTPPNTPHFTKDARVSEKDTENSAGNTQEVSHGSQGMPPWPM